jgi:ribosomal protein L7/L12
MFCSNCGTQIPDEANFCWKCGKPQNKDIETYQEAKWENCEILWNETWTSFTGNNTGFFSAEAINPYGKYRARRTKEFKLGIGGHSPSTDRRDQWNIHKAFVEQLLQDGWQATGDRGEAWWAIRFKRQVKDQNFTVVLISYEERGRYECTDIIQFWTGWSKYECIKFVDRGGGVILQDVNDAIANALKTRLEEAGAVVKLEKVDK